jgi:hypothetical protein
MPRGIFSEVVSFDFPVEGYAIHTQQAGCFCFVPGGLIQYGGMGCTISFGFEQHESHYRLNVYNSGRPISEEDHRDAKQKFPDIQHSLRIESFLIFKCCMLHEAMQRLCCMQHFCNPS